MNKVEAHGKTGQPTKFYPLMIPVIVGLLVGMFIYMDVTHFNNIFTLHFNKYALFPLVTGILTLLLLFSTLGDANHHEEMFWFDMSLGSIVLLATSDTFARLSLTPSGALFWSQFETAVGAFLSATMLLFALHYTHPERRHALYIILSMVGSIIIMFLAANTGLFFLNTAASMRLTSWGYVTNNGPLLIAYELWMTMGLVSAIALIVRFQVTTRNNLLKRQAKFFAFAIALPTITTIVTDFVFAGRFPMDLPSLGVFFTAIMMSILLFGLRRYQIFNISPSLLAQRILATMHEAVVVADRNLMIASMNKEAHYLFQTRDEASIGQSVKTIFHSLDTDRLENYFASAESSEHSVLAGLAFKVYDMRGTPIHLDVSVTPLHLGKRLEGYIFTIGDVTALKLIQFELEEAKSTVEQRIADRTRELQEEHARLQASIDSLNLGFLMTFTNSNAIYFNPALLRILGIQKDYHERMNLDVLAGYLKDSQLISEVAKSQETREAFRVQAFAYHDRILDISGSPVTLPSQADAIGEVILISDITEQKVFERSKDEFFSIASHELRTPLTAIKGNTSMILQYFPEIIEKDESLREMIEDMHESSDRLIAIVNDFLDVSRIEQGKVSFNFAVVNLEEIIESVVYEMRVVLKEKQLSLTYDTLTLGSLPPAWADKDRIKQVLYNLVGNAAKFTNQGGISIEAAVEGPMISVRVSDTGPGIPLDSQKLLFRKFQQAGKSLLTRDTTRGTGLGLYISKKLLESMGGSISLVRSEIDKGSTFGFTIPVASAAQQEKVQVPALRKIRQSPIDNPSQ